MIAKSHKGDFFIVNQKQDEDEDPSYIDNKSKGF